MILPMRLMLRLMKDRVPLPRNCANAYVFNYCIYIFGSLVCLVELISVSRNSVQQLKAEVTLRSSV